MGNLYPELCLFENLLLAFKKASRATKNKPETLLYFYNLEQNLTTLRERLEKETYRPGKYRTFEISDPKRRTISVSPFEDRVVHHAVVNILEPVYERRFIYDSYATRKDKGTHKAVRRAQTFLRTNKFYLKMDIHHYFDSVVQDTLINIIETKIKDQRVMRLIEKIIRNGGDGVKGLPIGNLTSQFFANCYLDVFDHWIKDENREKYYIRYMDDIVIFSNDKEHLKNMRDYCRYELKNRLGLSLKEKATYINTRQNGLSFLGTRIFPELIRINNKNLKRSLKRLKKTEQAFQKGLIEQQQFLQSATSIIAHLCQYDTWNLRNKFLRSFEETPLTM